MLRGWRLKPWAWGLAFTWLALAQGAANAADITWREEPKLGCQNTELARAQVEKLIGQSLAAIDWIDFEVEVTADDGGAYRVVLRTFAEGSAPREREITGASCAEVTDAVSVAIALTVSERERATGPEPTDGRSPVSVPAPVTKASPEPATTQAPRVAVAAGLLVDSGALPNLAPGLEVSGAFEWRSLRIGAFLGVLAPQDARLPGDARGGSFDLVLGGLEVCAKPALERLYLVACAGFELGRMSGRGDNVAEPRLGDAGWYAPRVALGVGYGLGDAVRLWLRGGAAVPLSRPSFLLDRQDSVHQAGNVAIRGLLGIEFLL